MSLLERIANSNGDPQKTIEALRLLNQKLQHQVADYAQRLATQVGTDTTSPGHSGEFTISSVAGLQLQLVPSAGIGSVFSQMPDLRWPGNHLGEKRP